MPIRVKICGLTDAASVQAAIDAGADYIGFVHFPASPRHLPFPRAAALKALLPSSIRSVSVLVNPDDDTLQQAQQLLAPDFIQLHGDESPARLHAIKERFPGLKLIKAIPVCDASDIEMAASYATHTDMLMFDAKAPASAPLPGGNGLAFDWSLLKHYTAARPWFLSGGLTAANVAPAIAASGPAMVDVSSGVERAPGVKDSALIHAFTKAAKTC